MTNCQTTQQEAAVKLDVPQATMCNNGSLWKKKSQLLVMETESQCKIIVYTVQ